MRRCAPFLIALLVACSQPLYDATAVGTLLTEWSHDEPGKTEEASFGPQTMTTASGAVLRVEGDRTTQDGKRLPTRIVVTLEDNPGATELSVNCRPPTQFDGDPADLLTSVCMVAELSGTESFLGSKEGTNDVSTLRVAGDGSVSLR